MNINNPRKPSAYSITTHRREIVRQLLAASRAANDAVALSRRIARSLWACKAAREPVPFSLRERYSAARSRAIAARHLLRRLQHEHLRRFGARAGRVLSRVRLEDRRKEQQDIHENLF
ncbi:MAG TPA: hypothetical protein VIY48_02950 [Candidatus Paceibacterota bacterium]